MLGTARLPGNCFILGAFAAPNLRVRRVGSHRREEVETPRCSYGNPPPQVGSYDSRAGPSLRALSLRADSLKCQYPFFMFQSSRVKCPDDLFEFPEDISRSMELVFVSLYSIFVSQDRRLRFPDRCFMSRDCPLKFADDHCGFPDDDSQFHEIIWKRKDRPLA